MENSFPRVLVISHTAFTKEDSMGSTLASYFINYPSDKIAQFYIKEMKPNIPVCFSYYKITDSELFRKIIKRSKNKQKCGFWQLFKNLFRTFHCFE